jgi:putative oligomerization/nucleic acid binding protein
LSLNVLSSDFESLSNTIGLGDELSKLAKLRDQGIITEAEFIQMKCNLIKRTRVGAIFQPAPTVELFGAR